MPMIFGKPDFFVELLRRFSAPGRKSHIHVLLHSTNGNDSDEPGAVQCLEPFMLADRIWICRMPDHLRDIVYKACQSPGEPYEPSFRQYGQLYTIALFMGTPEAGTVTSWDGYRHLSKVVTCSQLVHPTSIGFGNTAVLIFGPDGDFEQARPGPCRGFTEQAFSIPDTRNWLSQSECETVKDLFNNSNMDKLPDKVARAHWNFQYAAFQYFFEVRTLLVVSGLDALVHVRTPGRRFSTGAQFTARTVQLAADLGVSFTTDDANAVWEHRSDIAHGRDPWAFLKDANGRMPQPQKLTKSDEVVRRYLAAEQILRAAIVKCLKEPDFAKRFSSDEAIEKAYPITAQTRGKSQSRGKTP
jgi:hypothetical protein